MTSNNAYDKYREQSVMTMTHGEMLTKLFDGALKQLNAGILCIRSGDAAGANTALQKAQNILGYLQMTLDRKYAISENLSSLYTFFIEQSISANIRKDVKPLEDIIPLITELRDTFIQGDKLARMEKQQTAPAVRIG